MSDIISQSSGQWAGELARSERFAFGRNWSNFLRKLSDEKITQAEDSLKRFLDVENLSGKRFLDVGCGSGLFSLAARNLGAEVLSFDYDSLSVDCTKRLRERFYPSDDLWQIDEASVLDKAFLGSHKPFDFIYSWGVLHHTGDLWQSIDNILGIAQNDSKIYIAIYNRQKYASRYWAFVKRSYVRYRISRPLFFLIHLVYPGLPSIMLRLLEKRKLERGMSPFTDLVDWLGGYPFETSTPDSVVKKFFENGFVLANLRSVGGRSGCNEYLFVLG